MIKVVLIGNEKLLLRDLIEILKNFTEIFIVESFDSVYEGKRFFSKEKDIDLIFSDIQLLDGQPYELFTNNNLKIPVIFISDNNRYFIDVFDYNGIYFILKPLTEKKISKAIIKFKNFNTILQLVS